VILNILVQHIKHKMLVKLKNINILMIIFSYFYFLIFFSHINAW